MPDIYLDQQTFNQGQADLWERAQHGQLSEQWAAQATAQAPSMVADAQDRQRQQNQAAADAWDPTATIQQAVQAATPPAPAPAQPVAAPEPAPAAPPESPQDAQQPTQPVSVPMGPPETAAPAAPSPAAPAAAPASPTTAPLQAQPGSYQAMARDAAQRYGVDPDVFQRQIQQESGFNPNAVSPAGARGIAQFMPGTAQGLGVNPDDPAQALEGAARLMASNLQKYGGDYSKALAAYNAGGGNVDKYGGVPPFAETQRYVQNILGGAGQAISSAAQNVGQAVQQTTGDVLSKVQPFLGQSYVWGGKSPQQGFDCSGLAGYLTTGQPESTTSLYGKSSTETQDQAQPGDLVFWNMGSNDPHMQHVAVYLGNGKIAQSGGDQAAVNIGSVGQSIGSPPEFRRLGPGGAPAQAAAPVGAPSPADQPMDQTAASSSQPQQGMWDRLGSGIANVFQNIFSGGPAPAPEGGGYGAAPTGSPQTAVDQLTQAGQQAGGALQGFAQNGPIGAVNAGLQGLGQNVVAPALEAIAQPGGALAGPRSAVAGALESAAAAVPENVPGVAGALRFGAGAVGGPTAVDAAQTIQDLTNKYAAPNDPLGLRVSPAQMTPGDQQRYQDAQLAVAGVLGEPGANPFQLHTEPAPGRVPLLLDEAIGHIQDLEAQHTANDMAIQQLENRLQGGSLTPGRAETSGDVVRPTWAAGWTNDALRNYAKSIGANPYQPDWWPSQAGEAAKAAESGFKGTGAVRQTAADARQQLQQLYGQQDQIMAAYGHAMANGDQQLYRAAPAESDLPWAYTAPDAATAAQPATAPGLVEPSSTVSAGPALSGNRVAYAQAASSGIGTPAQATTGSDLAQLTRPMSGPPAPARPLFGRGGAPGGVGIAPAVPAPAGSTTDLLQAMLDHAKASGADANVTTAMQAQLDNLKTPVAPPPRPPTEPTGTPTAPQPPTPPTGGANAWDYLRALRAGSLAGGVSSIAHIALNSPLQAAWKLLGDAPLSITRPETIPLEFMGAWQEMRSWAAGAGDILTRPGKIAESIGGPAGQAVETGLLGLVKTHPVFQDMARRIGSGMETWRLAGVEASNAGLPRFSPQWWQRVQDLAAEPTTTMADAAQRAGDTFALRGPMGEGGQAVQEFLQSRFGETWGRFIVPFFNIGYHVAAQGIERSPIGILGTGADVLKGAYKGGAIPQGTTPLAERLRNNMLGIGLAVEAFHQAGQANVTGNGPDDPKLRADLMAQGWQPDSVRIGGRYFSLHMLGPEGWPLAEAANLYEATHTGEEGGYAAPNAQLKDQFGNYAGRMAQYAENETFLRGIGQIFQMIGNAKDFSRLGDQEVASVLESLIPQGGLLSNVASATDPFQRRPTPGDIPEAIQSRIPGLRQDLPLRITPTGQPEPNAQQGLGILLPRNTMAMPDPVLQALGAASIGAPTIPKTVNINSRYQIDLSPQEQQRYEELRGNTLNELVSDVASDPEFKTLSIDRQRSILQRAMTRAADVARRSLISEIPDSDLENRAVLTSEQKAAGRVTLGTAP